MRALLAPNSFDRVARLEKARKLTDVLAAAGIPLEPLSRCTAGAYIWRQAAQKAGCRFPSEATIALVLENLRAREVSA